MCGRHKPLLTTLEPLPEAIRLGRRANVKVVVQPAPVKHAYADVAKLPWSEVDVVVPNESEARELLVNHDVASLEAADDLAVALSEQMNGPTVVITLAEDGCIALSEGSITHYVADKVAEVIDTTGASDAFTAALTLELTAGSSESVAIRTALTAAASAVRKPGGHPSMPTAATLDLDCK